MSRALKPTGPQAAFEDIRHTEENGVEYWYARELATVLDYVQYRNFLQVVDKAREACRQSGHAEADHFADVSKMVEIGSGALLPVEDIQLSRYACYLVVQNGDTPGVLPALLQVHRLCETPQRGGGGHSGRQADQLHRFPLHQATAAADGRAKGNDRDAGLGGPRHCVVSPATGRTPTSKTRPHAKAALW